MPARDGSAELSVMSFGEHLEELRGRLIRALLVIGVGLIVALFFQDHILEFIAQPHRKAMGKIHQERSAKKWRLGVTDIADSLDQVDPVVGVAEARRDARANELMAEWQLLRAEAPARSADFAPYLAFLDRYFATAPTTSSSIRRLRDGASELAQRLKAPDAAEFGGVVREELDFARLEVERIETRLRSWTASALARANQPLPPRQADVERRFDRAVAALDTRLEEVDVILSGKLEETPLRLLKYTDSFFAHLKVSLLVALLFGLPWLAVEVWQFIAAGLYAGERHAVRPFLPFSLMLMFVGGMFGYSVLTPLGLTYLGGYGSAELLDTSFTLGDYISLVVTLILGMALVFQLPLVMVFLTRAGIVQTALFRRYRKICIIAAVLMGAMLTPPDVVTQVLMAAPLVVLFELGIIVSDLLSKKRK